MLCVAGRFNPAGSVGDCEACKQEVDEYSEQGAFNCKTCAEGKSSIGTGCTMVSFAPAYVKRLAISENVLNVTWLHPKYIVQHSVAMPVYQVKVAKDRSDSVGFDEESVVFDNITESTAQTSMRVVLPAGISLWQEVVYIRVRVLMINASSRQQYSTAGDWSMDSNRYKVALDCRSTTELLNNSDSDPDKWYCAPGECAERKGANCTNTSTARHLTVKAGWWRVRPSDYDTIKFKFERCDDWHTNANASKCLGGDQFAGRCREGFHDSPDFDSFGQFTFGGPLCTSCADGYIWTGVTCTKCTDSVDLKPLHMSSGFVLFLLASLLLIFILIFNRFVEYQCLKSAWTLTKGLVINITNQTKKFTMEEVKKHGEKDDKNFFYKRPWIVRNEPPTAITNGGTTTKCIYDVTRYRTAYAWAGKNADEKLTKKEAYAWAKYSEKEDEDGIKNEKIALKEKKNFTEDNFKRLCPKVGIVSERTYCGRKRRIAKSSSDCCFRKKEKNPSKIEPQNSHRRLQVIINKKKFRSCQTFSKALQDHRQYNSNRYALFIVSPPGDMKSADSEKQHSKADWEELESLLKSEYGFQSTRMFKSDSSLRKKGKQEKIWKQGSLPENRFSEFLKFLGDLDPENKQRQQQLFIFLQGNGNREDKEFEWILPSETGYKKIPIKWEYFSTTLIEKCAAQIMVVADVPNSDAFFDIAKDRNTKDGEGTTGEGVKAGKGTAAGGREEVGEGAKVFMSSGSTIDNQFMKKFGTCEEERGVFVKCFIDALQPYMDDSPENIHSIFSHAKAEVNAWELWVAIHLRVTKEAHKLRHMERPKFGSLKTGTSIKEYMEKQAKAKKEAKKKKKNVTSPA
jgi:hypothetical protein